MEFRKLLEPGKIGNVEIKNRFVMPPMGSNFASEESYVTDRMIEYYRTRAKGGFGLVTVEVTAVDRKGRAISNEVGLWDDSYIDGFTKLIKAVHDEGSKVFVQLHHCGRQTVPANIFGETPEAPSNIACPVMDTIPDQMTSERVWELVDQFGDAALRAKKAGADGIELMGTHGYLIAQFMSTHANKRIDEWGGDFFGRMKFPTEIIKNIRSKVGDDFPVSFRFSYDEKVHGGRTLEESVAIARLVEECGVDAISVSIMTYASMQYIAACPDMSPGFNQFPTKVIRESVSVPVISVGRYNPVIAENALRSGCADFIAFGRASFADPELPNKVAAGRLDEISPCISCTQSCLGYIFVGKPASCLVNPVAGHEFEYDLSATESPKNVLVVGGGPAGLMAAMTASKKGHKVTLCEKSDVLGGQFRLAAVPPTKHEIAAAIKYYITMCKKNGVDIRMNTEATKEFVADLKPDAVILATGSKPLRLPIQGIDGERVVDALDILDGKVAPGHKVLVAGGGMTGVETADFLGEHGRDVTIIELRDDIALDEAMVPRICLMQRLAEHDVKKLVSARIETFTKDGITYTQDNQLKVLGGFDTIVLAMGVRSYNPLEEELRDLVDEIYVVGDAEKAGPANHATETAVAAAVRL